MQLWQIFLFCIYSEEIISIRVSQEVDDIWAWLWLWRVIHQLDFILNRGCTGVLDPLPPQYSTYIWDTQISSWLALPCLHLHLPLLLPLALDVWHVTGFWSEWLRLSRLGQTPAHICKMCMQEVFSTGQGRCSQGKIQQTDSFTISQNITSTLASHQRPNRSP